uniref:Uncharacterized protein n=1 Tax=Strigamia maritima TaxID=126957 RepID=T1J9E8_STRMM
MNEDNSLFKKLLALNDKIEDLKEQQEIEDENGSRCGSLESFSDAEEGVTADQSASPTSTLSSSSSLTTHVYSRFLRPQQTSFILRRTSIPFQKEVSRPLKIITKDVSGSLLLVRTTKDSFLNNTTSPEMSAYDSGFHGSESDPENNEIFV